MRFWFGRILTFEVVGDAADPTIGAILGDASDGLIESSALDSVHGYAAYGSSRIAAGSRSSTNSLFPYSTTGRG